MYIPAAIHQPLCTYSTGKYVLHPDYEDNQSLRSWIEQSRFSQYESEDYQMSQHARQRNLLYSFHLDTIDKEVILKVSDHSQYQKWYRRLNQWLVSPFRNYSLSAYYGSIGLQKNKIDSIRVIAYWTHQDQGKKSYLLYEKVMASMTAADLCAKICSQHDDAKKIIDAIALKLAGITHAIHIDNMYHGDPHAGNFLLTTPVESVPGLTVESIEQLNFTLIDLDKTGFSRRHLRIFKPLADLRDLRRFRVHNIEGIECLPYYLGHPPSTMQKMILQFWMRGGFNLYKWFKCGSKRK